MASYTRRYPNTGSTLTINYPDGLFSDIVEDPRTLYRVSQESELYYTPYDFDDQGNKIYKTDKDYGRLAYPDLILIPANGSFINEHADMYEITTIRSFRKNDNGVWEKTDERRDETHKKADGDYYYISIYGVNQLWFRGSPNTLIDNRCYSCGEISIHESMEANEIDYCVPSDLSERYAYDTRETHITITIYGEAKFFKSNATHYFCEGTSETNGTLYCNSYFGEDKHPVGGIIVSNRDKEIIEISPVSLLNRGGRGSNYYSTLVPGGGTRVMDFSNCKIYTDNGGVIPQYSSSDAALDPNDIYCEGFRFKRDLDSFPKRYLVSDDDSLFQAVDYTYRNSYISFVLDPMVMISDSWVQNGWGYHYYMERNPSNDTIEVKCGTCWSYDENGNQVQHHINMKTMWETSSPYNYELDTALWKFPRYDKYTVDYWGDGDVWLHPQYYITTEKAFFGNGNLFEYIDKNYELQFSGYFTTENEDSNEYPKDPHQYLVAPWKGEDEDSEYQYIPIYEYGTVLYPVFYHPQCAYVKFNCEQSADPKNVVGNNTHKHRAIERQLEAAYGKNYLYRNIDKWSTGDSNTVMDEVIRLKASKAKFKIVYVNSHGGKNESSDKSYAHMSYGNPALGIPDRILTNKHMRHLLTNMRPDEYYFFYLQPCFSGGLTESVVHNQKDDPNYTKVLPSGEFEGNYIIWYSDCANSTAWSQGDGYTISDLYDLQSKSKTYKQQADYINTVVQECRTKNVQLLVQFMQKHYEFMKTTLLDDPLIIWNQSTYDESVNNASNLLIMYSREDEAQKTVYARRYPLLFVFQMLMYFSCYPKTLTRVKCSKIEFLEKIYGYAKNANYLIQFCEEKAYTLRHKGNPAIFEPENQNTARYDSETRDLFMQHFDFLYDLYQCWNNMFANAKTVIEINQRNSFVSCLLDEIPGVVFKGSQEFGNCVLPKFPGYDPNKKISEEKLQEMLFKQPIEE